MYTLYIPYIYPSLGSWALWLSTQRWRYIPTYPVPRPLAFFPYPPGAWYWVWGIPCQADDHCPENDHMEQRGTDLPLTYHLYLWLLKYKLEFLHRFYIEIGCIIEIVLTPCILSSSLLHWKSILSSVNPSAS